MRRRPAPRIALSHPGPPRWIAVAVIWVGAWIALHAEFQAANGQARVILPDPVISPRSTEICLNSRLSYHGGWSGAATDQMLADVLHASSRAAAIGGSLVIYAATSSNVYLYDPPSNSLIVHKAGDWRSDASAAFEVGIAAGDAIRAGAAMHLAQLESIALWTGTASQLASCPRASATTYANSHWGLVDPVDIVISFGIRNVAGLTTTLVAVSSDASLPDPETDGPVYMDDALADFTDGSLFDPADLTPDQVSQLLWATYGCNDHMAAGKAGIVCSSAVANYYLTRRIYLVDPAGVYRYHIRRPPGTDAATRDHRIEPVTPGETRPALREGAPGLPIAPIYLILCAGTTGAWPELEVGFAAMGVLLEASTIGCQGHLTIGFSAETQTAIRVATGIPTTDSPLAIVSLGLPSDPAAVDPPGDPVLRLSMMEKVVSSGPVQIRYEIPKEGMTSLVIYDCQGHEVRGLVRARHTTGMRLAAWDCRDAGGRPVASGVYFCRLRLEGLVAQAQFVVIR